MNSDSPYVPGHGHYVTDAHSFQYPSTYHYSYGGKDSYTGGSVVDGSDQYGELDDSQHILDQAEGDAELPDASTDVSEHVVGHEAAQAADVAEAAKSSAAATSQESEKDDSTAADASGDIQAEKSDLGAKHLQETSTDAPAVDAVMFGGSQASEAHAEADHVTSDKADKDDKVDKES